MILWFYGLVSSLVVGLAGQVNHQQSGLQGQGLHIVVYFVQSVLYYVHTLYRVYTVSTKWDIFSKYLRMDTVPTLIELNFQFPFLS